MRAIELVTNRPVEVYQVGFDCVADAITGHAYTIHRIEADHELYVPIGDNSDAPMIRVDKCECQGGPLETVPGAFVNGDVGADSYVEINRCDDCARFASDDDAANAYAQALNRMAGGQHVFLAYLDRRAYLGNADAKQLTAVAAHALCQSAGFTCAELAYHAHNGEERSAKKSGPVITADDELRAKAEMFDRIAMEVGHNDVPGIRKASAPVKVLEAVERRGGQGERILALQEEVRLLKRQRDAAIAALTNEH